MSDQTALILSFQSAVRGAKMFGFDLKITPYELGGKDYFSFYLDGTQGDNVNTRDPWAWYDNIDAVRGFINGLEVAWHVGTVKKLNKKKGANQ